MKIFALLLALIAHSSAFAAGISDFFLDNGTNPYDALEVYDTYNSLPNFHEVTPEIWRSARLPADGITYLAQSRGLRTIIDLEHTSSAIQEEAAIAQSLGITHISVPIFPWKHLPEAAFDQLLDDLIQGRIQTPVLIHCRQGKDRTGLFVGLYRVFAQGWSPEEAYREMLSFKFATDWEDLDNYFRKKTGYSGPKSLR